MVMDKNCVKVYIKYVSVIKDYKLQFIESFLIIHVLYFHFTLNIKLNEKSTS